MVHQRSPSWFRLVQTEDAARFDQALALASELLPLDAIATGPEDEPGFDPQFEVHDTLLVVVQSLVDAPGRGLNLIAAALQSPVIRVRRGALRVLAAWADEGSLRELGEARALLEQAATREVDEELAGELAELLEHSA